MSAPTDVVMDNMVVTVLPGRIALVACQWCADHLRAIVATEGNPITLRRLFVAAQHKCAGDPAIRTQLLAMLDGGPNTMRRPSLAAALRALQAETHQGVSGGAADVL